MKTNNKKVTIKDNDYHCTRLTLRWTDDKSGFDLKVETAWNEKFTKEDRESCLQFEAKNMSRMGMNLFIAFCQDAIGGNAIREAVDAILA